jgi:hypothetical protein
MSRAAPVFLFEIVSAVAALRIMSSSIPPQIICSKLVQHVIDIDLLIGVETVEDCAINYLSVLGEAHPEGADDVLVQYICDRVLFKRNGKARGWSASFSNPMRGMKTLNLDKILLRRNFQAFIYRYKNGLVKPVTFYDVKENEFVDETVKKIIDTEFTITDVIESGQ